MELTELQSSDKERYNQFVASAPTGSFLQSWEWGQWQEKLGKQAFRFFLLDDDNNIQASLQVIQSPLPLGRYYLYIPYGPVIKENFQFSIFNFQFLSRELQKRFSSAVFIRLEPKDDRLPTTHYPLLTKSTNIQPGKTLVIDLQQSQNELLAGMHPKTRYNIKLAQRHGVEVAADLIVVPGHGLYVKEALDLIVQTADRQSFQTFPKGYYEQLLDFFALQNFGGDVKIFLYKALLGRELLSAAVMVDFSAKGGSPPEADQPLAGAEPSGGGTRTYLFGGSAAHHREVMAPYLLHFQAMLDAKDAGLKIYDFWGVETSGGETPGFVRFKLGFGGQIASYPGAWDITLRRVWYHGYKTLRKINRALIHLKFFR